MDSSFHNSKYTFYLAITFKHPPYFFFLKAESMAQFFYADSLYIISTSHTEVDVITKMTSGTKLYQLNNKGIIYFTVFMCKLFEGDYGKRGSTNIYKTIF